MTGPPSCVGCAVRILCAAAVALTLAGCHARMAGVRPTAASADESELLVYVQPLPAGADRLAFTVASLSAIGADGAAVPLELAREVVSGREPSAQRLLARGRLPPGSYAGFELRVGEATLATDGPPAALLVAAEPARIEAPFTAVAGRPGVLWLDLSPERSLPAGAVAFAPVFLAATPPRPVVQRVGYASSPALDRLLVFDKRQRLVVGAVATGRGPHGVAVHERLARAYVALAGDDDVQVVDVASGEPRARIRLAPGDAPRDVALTPDGRVLVTANSGSNTASFVDPLAETEVARARTGDEPSAILLDRGGRRAFVLNRRSATITVLDVGNRAAVATIATEAEPVRAQLDRAGTRLYVVHAASPYMTVISVPDLAVRSRVFVGFGATSVQVDPRTDLVYVGQGGEAQLRVLDPFSLVQVDAVALPGAAAATAVDDAENALVAVLPEQGRVTFVDLTSKRALSSVDVGHAPYDVAVVRERF